MLDIINNYHAKTGADWSSESVLIWRGNHRLGNQEQLPLFIGHDGYWLLLWQQQQLDIVISVADSSQALLWEVWSMTLCGDEYCHRSSQSCSVSENAQRLHTQCLCLSLYLIFSDNKKIWTFEWARAVKGFCYASRPFVTMLDNTELQFSDNLTGH